MKGSPSGDKGSSFISLTEGSSTTAFTGEKVSPDKTAWGDEAKGWKTSFIEEGGSEAVFSNQLWIEPETGVKLEASSHALRRASAFSIASSVRGVRKDLIPSNLSMEEMAMLLPAVAFDEEGSQLLPLRFSGSETALLAVEDAEINGSSSSLALVWLPSDTGKFGPGSLRDLKGTTSPKFRPLRSMSQFSKLLRSYQIDS